jgi:hypothetical protein
MNSSSLSYRGQLSIVAAALSALCLFQGAADVFADSSVFTLRNDTDCPTDPYYLYRLCDGAVDTRLEDVGQMGPHSVILNYVVAQCANTHTPGLRIHFLSGTYSNVDFDMGPSPYPTSTSYQVPTPCNPTTNDTSTTEGPPTPPSPGAGPRSWTDTVHRRLQLLRQRFRNACVARLGGNAQSLDYR